MSSLIYNNVKQRKVANTYIGEAYTQMLVISLKSDLIDQ